MFKSKNHNQSNDEYNLFTFDTHISYLRRKSEADHVFVNKQCCHLIRKLYKKEIRNKKKTKNADSYFHALNLFHCYFSLFLLLNNWRIVMNCTSRNKIRTLKMSKNSVVGKSDYDIKSLFILCSEYQCLCQFYIVCFDENMQTM